MPKFPPRCMKTVWNFLQRDWSRRRVKLLCAVLIFETLLFFGSAVNDVIEYPREQVVSAVLRTVIAVLSGIAGRRVFQVLKKTFHQRRRGAAGVAWRESVVHVAQPPPSPCSSFRPGRDLQPHS
ncbi:hypothetical protein [Streptomyces sp. C10]|uniref:hypothetical protein n=1 Tax=Streptomyces sp. C10 TaxID=531941 RepID=UPI00397FD91A